MTENREQNQADEAGGHALAVAGDLLGRLISLVTMVVCLAFFLIICLISAHLYFVLDPNDLRGASAAAEHTLSLLLNIWQAVTPLAATALRVVAPVVLIIGVATVVAHLTRRGTLPLELSRIAGDLPSLLAIIIIFTICVLPLSGLEVPSALNNIALVVVGFYFGKRDSKE